MGQQSDKSGLAVVLRLPDELLSGRRGGDWDLVRRRGGGWSATVARPGWSKGLVLSALLAKSDS